MLSSILNLIFFILNSNIFLHKSFQISTLVEVIATPNGSSMLLMLLWLNSYFNSFLKLEIFWMPYNRHFLIGGIFCIFFLIEAKKKSYSLNLLFILNKKIALHSIFCLPTFLQCRSRLHDLQFFILYLFIQFRKNGNLLVCFSEVVDFFFIKICCFDCFFFHWSMCIFWIRFPFCFIAILAEWWWGYDLCLQCLFAQDDYMLLISSHC